MKEEIAREKHFPSQPSAGPDSGHADHESKSAWIFFFFSRNELLSSLCGRRSVEGEGGGGCDPGTPDGRFSFILRILSREREQQKAIGNGE